MHVSETYRLAKFSELLNKVEINSVPGHAYCKSYLDHLLIHRVYYLKIYNQLFNLLKKYTAKSFSDLFIVDYGCGNGLLGIYAAFCGFKNVLLVDTDEAFVVSAQNLARQLNISVNLVTGDYHQLTQVSKPDVIIGTDVIEHIYNIDEMFEVFQNINP